MCGGLPAEGRGVGDGLPSKTSNGSVRDYNTRSGTRKEKKKEGRLPAKERGRGNTIEERQEGA